MAKKVLQQLASGPLTDWQKIELAVKVRTLKTGDCLFHADERKPTVYFIRQGLIKMIYETADGKVWVKAFAEEGRFFASLTALSAQGKTSFMANCAHIATRVSDKDLAAYIRVTPVALSRIKKRVRLAGTIPP